MDVKASVISGLFAVAAIPNLWAAPTPSQIAIKNVTVSGTGCPAFVDTPYWTATRPGGPADYFEVLFNDFVVSKGNNIPIGESRKQCTISVDVNIPQGFSFSLINVAWEGYGDIPAGYLGMQTASYQFPQFSNRAVARTRRTGPFVGNWYRDDQIAVRASVWSPCGLEVPFHIKADMQLRGFNANRQALMTTDQVTGVIRQIWGVRWRRC